MINSAIQVVDLTNLAIHKEQAELENHLEAQRTLNHPQAKVSTLKGGVAREVTQKAIETA